MWAPLLDSKFDGHYDDLPATYIWARTRRMSKTRDRSGAEVMGWLEGGYQTLIDALERRIVELGGEIHTGVAVEQIVGRQRLRERAPRQRRYRRSTPCSARWRRRWRAGCSPRRSLRAAPETTAATSAWSASCCGRRAERQPLLPPEHHRQARAADDDRRDHPRRRPRSGRRPSALRLEVRRPVDARPEAAATTSSSATTSAHARTIFPDLADDDILASVVQRAPVTEPVHILGGAQPLPDDVPGPGPRAGLDRPRLPGDRQRAGGHGVAERVLPGVLERLPA